MIINNRTLVLIIDFYYICITDSEMEKITAKYLTSHTAAQLLDAKEVTLRKIARESDGMVIRKCADGHYRGTEQDWKKLLGLK